MKAKFLLILMFVGVLVFAAFDSSEPGWIGPQYPEGEEPTVITDLDDYYPGDIAIISGHGWTLDTRVDIILEETPYQGHDEAFSVIVESDGTWIYEFPIDWRHLGVAFHLKAKGNVTDYVAETFFTDAPRIGEVTLNPDLRETCVPNSGTSEVTYTVSANRTQAGTISPSYSISGLPAGVTFSGLTGFTSNGNSAFPDRTLTLTVASSVTPGTYPFTVILAAGQDVSTGGQGTLIVNQAPDIDALSDLNVNTDLGVCSAEVQYSVSASGSPAPTFTYVFSGVTTGSGNGTGSGETFNIGVTTVEVTATNICGSDTEIFTITVEDKEDPMALTQDITVQLDATGNASITPAMIDNGSNDACGIQSLSLDIDSFDCSNVGSNTVTLTVTDNNGNTGSATATVTVEDNVDPTALVKNYTLQLDNTGNGVLLVSNIDNGSFDNCGIVTSDLSKANFTCSDQGDNLVTLTVTDAAGNTNSANATVTVLAPITPISVNINSTVAPNGNGNVVIFDGAAASLGLPSTTTLSAAGIPSTYTGLTYQWFWRNTPSGSFQSSPISTSPSIVVNAADDFAREYKLIVLSNSGCIAENTISVISVEASCGNGNGNANKVQVCHVTPNGMRKTICVSANAVDALLAGSPGSYVGNCNVSYRLAEEPELIKVEWNTPVEVIQKEIIRQSQNWFNGLKISLNINEENYNPHQPGFYQLTVDMEANEWFVLDEPINIGVLVLNKPMPTEIILESNVLPADAQVGQVISLLNTIDPADNIHTYSMEEHPNLEIEGNSLIWKGNSPIGNVLKATVHSTDRAGQTISREVTLYREIKPSEIAVYPNPANAESNIQVQLYQGSDVSIRIFDAAGRMVYQEEAYQENSFVRNIDLKGLANGMYHIIVKVDHQVMTKRLIKD